LGRKWKCQACVVCSPDGPISSVAVQLRAAGAFAPEFEGVQRSLGRGH
jgi:hypothetical protein